VGIDFGVDGRYLGVLPPRAAVLLIDAGIIGGITLLIAARFLAFGRQRLPPLPALGESGGRAEVVACRICGAPVQCEAREIVSRCGYCGADHWRADMARWKQWTAAADREDARFSLEQAVWTVTEQGQTLIWLFKVTTFAVTLAVLLLGATILLGDY
jgi:hypothetical protein